MVVFYKENSEHVGLMYERYNPAFAIEMFKITMKDPDHVDAFMEAVQDKNWDLIFLILMYDCPEEVIVECDLRENTLKDVFGYDIQELNFGVIEEEIHHKHPNNLDC